MKNKTIRFLIGAMAAAAVSTGVYATENAAERTEDVIIAEDIEDEEESWGGESMDAIAATFEEFDGEDMVPENEEAIEDDELEYYQEDMGSNDPAYEEVTEQETDYTYGTDEDENTDTETNSQSDYEENEKYPEITVTYPEDAIPDTGTETKGENTQGPVQPSIPDSLQEFVKPKTEGTIGSEEIVNSSITTAPMEKTPDKETDKVTDKAKEQKQNTESKKSENIVKTIPVTADFSWISGYISALAGSTALGSSAIIIKKRNKKKSNE